MRDGNRDGISIETIPLLGLLGKLIASRFRIPLYTNPSSDQPIQRVEIGGDVRRHLDDDSDGLDPLTVAIAL